MAALEQQFGENIHSVVEVLKVSNGIDDVGVQPHSTWPLLLSAEEILEGRWSGQLVSFLRDNEPLYEDTLEYLGVSEDQWVVISADPENYLWVVVVLSGEFEGRFVALPDAGYETYEDIYGYLQSAYDGSEAYPPPNTD